jgi:hypothetical protein
MYRKGRLLTYTIVTALILVLAAFAIAFGYLIINAFSLTNTAIGLNTSFTGYEYISIEATWVVVILYGGYYIINSALRRPTIEISVEED